jgi:hypothetical protein
LNYFSNKENDNYQNTIGSPRISLKSQRNSFGGAGSVTPRAVVDDNQSSRKRNSFLTVQSKTDQALLDRPRLNRTSNRVHTESGPLIICKRLYPDFILEMDEEECF